MRITKRWFALMLTISVALSDCGSITVFAAENAIAVETPDSENKGESFRQDEEENTISDEMPSEHESVSEDKTGKGENIDVLPENFDEDMGVLSEDTNEDKDADGDKINEETDSVQDEISASETDTVTELPALHIGQIKKGEEFPDSDDSKIVYDLPVSFEMSDSVILFVCYDTGGIDINNTDMALENEEDKKNRESEEGTLVWSIIRGKHGLEEGSVNLIKEEDDWIGFEDVSDSPYFTMTENEEGGNAYYKTVELTARDAVENEDYNYYIRAAYYFGTEEEKDEEFYAATTIPFLPGKNADIDGTQDDSLDEEEVNADEAQDDTIDAEGVNIDETQDDVLDTEADGIDETQDDEPGEEESDIAQVSQDTDIEDAVTFAGTDSTAEGVSGLSESDEIQQGSKESVGVLSLSAERVTMHPGDWLSVSATIEPTDLLEPVSWTTSDEGVAIVDAVDEKNGMIFAMEEGVAQITAECNGIKAAVRVEVVKKDENEVYDLSNDIWVAGFKEESEDFVYTGNKITQDIRVYHKETLLKEKTDYTLSYKNNVNAAAYNAAKAPSVTITFKGQYSGSVTLYYTINPANINDIDIYNTDNGGADDNGTAQDSTDADNANENKSSGYEQAVTYSKTLKIPNPELTYGKKKLTVNKDFVCDYTTLPQPYKKGDSYEAGKVYNYTVNGKGNFTGSFQMRLVVVNNKNFNFNSASVTLGQKQYEYHGTALSKSDVTIEKLTLNKSEVDKSLYDYEVCAAAPEGAYVMVYPTNAGKDKGYHGSKKVSLKLVGDRNIIEAVSGGNWKESIDFSQQVVNEEGGIFQQKTDILRFGTDTEPLIEGEDYTVKYGNAKKVGKVTVTFTGKGRYKGTIKKTYEITPNIDTNNFTIGWKNVTRKGNDLEIAYQKGGAMPNFVLRDQNNNVLKNKTDYTVKVTNNKTPGTALLCEINGKGNYKGYQKSVQIMVKNGDISKGTISLIDKPYSTKANAWKSTVTIKDVNGKKLTAGTDYETFEYKYDNMENVQYPAAGSIVTVTVHGIGYYEGTGITGTYRIYEKSISKLKITIDEQEYTGKEITLSPYTDIHAYANSTDQKKNQNELGLPWAPCYEVVGYSNNTKAGTAKVTLRGVGEYGGTRTCSFKIRKKKYGINRVKGIKFDKTSLAFSLEETRSLTATITPEEPYVEIANQTVIWSVSNSNIATVEVGSAQNNYDGSITISAKIIPQKAGSVTITATAQDGNKKAQCKVSIVSVPLLKEAGQTIVREVGDTYQLGLEEIKSPLVTANGIKWSSSRSAVASVDSKGLVTLKKVGATIIKMTSADGKLVQECYVAVIPKGGEVLPEGKNYLTFEQKSGSTDDTDAINALIVEAGNTEGCDGVYIPAGVYKIDADLNGANGKGLKSIRISEQKNLDLIISPSALLMALPNSLTNYAVIWVDQSENITVSGGTIMGERNGHRSTQGEAGHGVKVDDSKNVIVSDMEIYNCWGDGIYLGSNDPNYKKTNTRVTITNCNAHDNRRNNLSIVAADYVTVDQCKFNNAKGTDPQFGIDIETNNSNNPCEHITISNTEMKGNAKASMGIMTAANDIKLENCTLSGHFYNWAGKNVVIKNTTIGGDVVDITGGITRK